MVLSCSKSSPHEELLIEMTETTREVTKILKHIETVEDALSVKADLKRLQDRGFEIRERMKALIGQEVPWAAKDRVRRAIEENEYATGEMLKEARRLQKNPDVWAVLANILMGR
jgi:hypothetical protein